MTTVFPHSLAPLGLSLLLAGCASALPTPSLQASAPVQWQAPLPHQGQLGQLSDWWQQQGDPVLVELIDAAQTVSPSVAQAMARVESARAQRTAAQASLLPKLDATASASRGVSQIDVPVATSQSVGLQASWELDLVGANRTVRDAATAQLQGVQAQWHDARVAVAAEVANTYYSLSTCLQLLEVVQQDARSRQETARLTALNAQAGFAAPAMAALARASAADGASRQIQQQTACDIDTKALVALTAMAEPVLRDKLRQALQRPAQASPIAVTRVPAQTLAQRPDVYAAERDVVFASAQVSSAQAQRYPRLTLNGSVGALRYTSNGRESNLDTWSFGPLALSVPLFDGGQRKANVASAQAAYQQAVAVYHGKVRQAVREVEEALLNLHSTEQRSHEAVLATDGYGQALSATQTRYAQGLASLVELEDARRSALAARSAQLSLALERNRAWVSLYRALGGGFDPEASAATTAAASPTPPIPPTRPQHTPSP